MAKDKKKKEKVIYYDDGRTVADMSNLPRKSLNFKEGDSPSYDFKSKAQTFFGAIRLMLVPTVAVVCVLGIIYCIMYLLLSLAK